MPDSPDPAGTRLLDDLHQVVLRSYPVAEFPALSHQAAAWRDARPLAGVRVLDATPAWRNTLAKHLALVAAGAELTVAAVPEIPQDPRILSLLADLGITVITDPERAGDVDVACDCAGALVRVPARFGAVELTASGGPRYAGSHRPVVLVDSGRLKVVETSLGTGDGFVRAMRHLGHDGFVGGPVVVFGAGKVGRGVAIASVAAGAKVTLVDFVPAPDLPAGCAFVPAGDSVAVRRVVTDAWCVVTATGVIGAVTPHAADLVASAAVLANMGVDDEYGPDVPRSRILTGGRPLNFVLDEPTRLRYLDPVFALSNLAAARLPKAGLPPGVSAPPWDWERAILSDVLAHGALAPELRRALPGLAAD